MRGRSHAEAAGRATAGEGRPGHAGRSRGCGARRARDSPAGAGPGPERCRRGKGKHRPREVSIGTVRRPGEGPGEARRCGLRRGPAWSGAERTGAIPRPQPGAAQLGPAQRSPPRPPQPRTHPLAASSRVLQCQQ